MKTSLNSTSQNLKICSIVFDDVDFDSRFKRALSALSQFSDKGIIYSLNKSSALGHPFPVKVSRRGRKLFLIECLWWLLKDRPQVVFAGGLLPLVPAAILKLFFGYLLIYDARELYLKDSKGKSTYSNLHRFIEKVFSPFANIVVAANEDRAAEMKKFYRRDIDIVRNISESFESKDPKSEELDQISTHKFLVYQGHLGETRGALNILYEHCRILTMNTDFSLSPGEKG